MPASRRTLGLAVLVTVVLVVSSLGLLSVVSGTGGSPSATLAASTLTTPSKTASGSAPTTLGSGATAALTHTTPTSGLSAPPTPRNQQVSPGADANSSLATKILSSLAAKGVPLRNIQLPYLLESPDRSLTNGHVNLSYTSSPAPYGIGDFGLKNVSGVINPYRLSTSSVEANFSTDHLSGYSPDLSSPDEWGVQLNAVLNNVTLFGSTGYQFWTQNVFEYSPSLQAIVFVSNIWNFSNSQATLSCNFLYQTNGNNHCPQYYYGQTGYIPATEPFVVQLYLNSSLIDGRDAVYFNYSLTSGLGTSSANYNYAIFNSTMPGANPATTPKPVYVANGFQYNPLGLPDDFEITLGGPGGGSNFDVLESASTYMSLQYWNSTLGEYLTVPTAFNVGGETGETSVGVNAAWAQFGTGTPFPASCVECVSLSNGPSFLYGMWGVGGAGVGGISPRSETDWPSQSAALVYLNPVNAFLFIAEGFVFTGYATTNYSLFQWAPDLSPNTYFLDLPIGNYTAFGTLADYSRYYWEFPITANVAASQTITDFPGPYADPTVGVDTPLWAFNATGVAAISSGTDAYGNEILDNSQYAPIGQIPATSVDASLGNYFYEPWFGLYNDFGFPVFPGILLSGVSGVDVVNAPSFDVAAPGAPSSDLQMANYLGWPTTNDLQMFFWGDDNVNLEGSTVGGWFPATSDFGPSQSFASVVFWNTSDSMIANNTFNVGGMGLFLYGGINNEITGNTFLTATAPISANPYATAGAEFGSIGLVDADFGDAELYGAVASTDCLGVFDDCDLVYNNAFDTLVTAMSPTFDPYTGNAPNQYPYDFSQAWNVQYTPGVTNIVGGNYLGGNYYWDYGYAENPYGILPDIEENWLPYENYQSSAPVFICGIDCYGGDYYPLVNVPLYQITFKEQGLPSGAYWSVDLYVPAPYYFLGDDAYNWSYAPGETNLTESAGTWYYYPYTDDRYFAATPSYGTVTVNQTTGNVVVTVKFVSAYVLTVKETGLPKGTDWYGETYNSSTGYDSNGTTKGSENNVSGLIASTYTWWAYTWGSAENQYAGIPYQATVTLSANATVDVTFVAVYVLDVHALGLPAGARWSFDATSTSGYNYTAWNTGPWINTTTAALTYVWAAGSAGFVATPGSGVLTLAANTTLTLTFQAATLTFSESNLPSGTPWTVALTQGTNTTTLGSTGSSIVFTAVVGAYTYKVSANGYAATPSSGSGSLPADPAVSVVFALATGTLSGTVSPSGATLWVDGTEQTLSSGGTYSLTLPVGVHSIEAMESGYVTYYNNATLTLGTTTNLNVTLASSSTSASGFAGISTMGWVLIGVLAALAAVFLVTTIIFARRGRQQPPVAPYSASPPPATGAPPAWEQPPPPPPGTS